MHDCGQFTSLEVYKISTEKYSMCFSVVEFVLSTIKLTK